MQERTGIVLISTTLLLTSGIALAQIGLAKSIDKTGAVQPAVMKRLRTPGASNDATRSKAEKTGSMGGGKERTGADLVKLAQNTSNSINAEIQGPSGELKSSAREHLMSSLANGNNALLLQGNRIADIAEAAAPAVVNIEIEKQGLPAVVMGLPGFFGSDKMPFFFNGKDVSPKDMGRMRSVRGTGSGFIIRSDGYILTNVHVVKDAQKIDITLHDGRTYGAKLVGIDSFSDLAVLHIDAKDLPTLKTGTSSTLRPGEFVVAIGSPLNYDHTVTFGIVSGVGRSVYEVNENINFIQTDAAINQGNSGGPLLNLKGEVIGVNTAVVRGYVAQNIGFSIPVDVAKSVAEDLINHRKIHRPWLGIAMKPVSGTLVKSMGLPPDTTGVVVASTFENSPAERAGLKKEDIIQKIDGKKMMSPKDIRDYVRTHKINETLSFYVLRNGAGQAVEVNIGEYPSGVYVVPHQNEKKDPNAEDQQGE